jgi:lycopene cyclase domain-containing protein
VNYSIMAAVGVLAAAMYDLAVARTRLLARKAFWTAYAIVLGFQLIVNGVLTGLSVVTYDERRIIGWRIVDAPIEDLLFGFAMVLATLTTWVWLGRHARSGGQNADRQPPRSRGAAGRH